MVVEVLAPVRVKAFLKSRQFKMWDGRERALSQDEITAIVREITVVVAREFRPVEKILFEKQAIRHREHTQVIGSKILLEGDPREYRIYTEVPI